MGFRLRGRGLAKPQVWPGISMPPPWSHATQEHWRERLKRSDALLDAEVFDAWDGYYGEMATAPGYFAYFRDNPEGTIKSFKTYLEGRALKTSGT